MAEPALFHKPMTFEEAALLNPDEQPGELVDGVFIPVTKSTWRHGEVGGNIYAALNAYRKTHPGWSLAIGDPGTKLKRDPDLLRGPDVGMVRQERRPTGRGVQGWLDGAPDLAVEVLGDSQETGELIQKGLQYLAAGGQMVWIVEPDPQRVIVLTSPDRIRVYGPDDTLDGGDLLPDFSCPVAEFFL
jgi:Uma2 family endonuclease